MLTTATITTLLPVTDVDRASQFYAESLGLKRTGTGSDGSVHFATGGGDMLALRPMPPGAQSEHTALSFEVPDLAAEIADLESRGVRFSDFDSDELRTVDHIANLGDELAAWFHDTEGNVLCLHQAVTR
ncbi:VOC family protein [Prauserella muralis]|uniref:Glyoxalase n=1 Tax=Prauserella muralis TaxID=588067 RepID=A0A2V4B752_9PSEU|nr:VOC family protein [Prauserella muralis]PXY31057.1 glyoxalase [Prauserella muralis]TWE14664.1 putative enzyme related to lactoylglutathione lyase [Prauserella muralis]